MEKIYHIYAKDKCIFHSVKEEEFTRTWDTLTKLVGLMKTDYQVSDLSYEELTVNKEIIRNSSYWQILNRTIKLILKVFQSYG